MIVSTARKVIVFVIGISVVLVGIVMIVAPGPAVVVIPAGLAILGTEFLWARRLLSKMKGGAKDAFKAMGVSGIFKDAPMGKAGPAEQGARSEAVAPEANVQRGDAG